jgi:hypothetical protein
LNATLVAKAVADRVLDLERREVQALERTVLGRDLDLDGLLRREPDFPGDLAGRGVQVVFAAVAPVPELHQHPLRQAAVQVELEGVAPRGLQRHAGAPLLHRRLAGDARDLGGQVVLHASGAG